MRLAPSRMTKLLFFAGVAVIAATLTQGEAGVRKPTASAVAEIFGDYPGPCIAAPSNLSLDFVGLTSGCTKSGGNCQSDEEFLITAVSTTYVFQYCDTYKWTFGDDGTTITTSYYPSIRHKFLGAGPRTVDLTVTNKFGSASPTKLTIPEPLTPCVRGGETDLCLGEGANLNRFKVTLFAVNRNAGSDFGKSGAGKPLIKGDQFGYFSIPALTGDASNPEVFVKVLDGTSINGNFWIFWGGLTNLEYTLTVQDTKNGKIESYFKEGLVSKGGADTAAFNGAAYTDPTGTNCPKNANSVPVVEAPVAPSTCTAPDGAAHHCLAGNRFKVSLTAVNRNAGADFGKTGAGLAIKEPAFGGNNPFGGYFSIPALTGEATRPEVFVKILDGRAFTGHFWMFGGALTNFETTLRVEDTVTGKVYSYKTPAADIAPEKNGYCGVVDTGSL